MRSTDIDGFRYLEVTKIHIRLPSIADTLAWEDGRSVHSLCEASLVRAPWTYKRFSTPLRDAPDESRKAPDRQHESTPCEHVTRCEGEAAVAGLT
jgi:hypothetical protein